MILVLWCQKEKEKRIEKVNLGYSFPDGLLVDNVGEVLAGVVVVGGDDPPNDVVGWNFSVDAAEAVVPTGSEARGEFAGCVVIRRRSEVVGHRGKPSGGGFKVVVVVVLRHRIVRAIGSDHQWRARKIVKLLVGFIHSIRSLTFPGGRGGWG